MPEETFHPAHACPTDDIVFKSNQGTFFRASSWRLKRISSLHFDESQLPIPLRLRDDTSLLIDGESILIDAEDDAVDLFLSLVLVQDRRLPDLKIAQLLQLEKIFDRYNCDVLKPKLKPQFWRLRITSPWEVIAYASRNGEVNLARGALRRFTQDSFITGQPANLWEKVATLDPKWHLPMISAIFGTDESANPFDAHYNTPLRSVEVKKSFQDIASSFDPNPKRTLDNSAEAHSTKKKPKVEPK